MKSPSCLCFHACASRVCAYLNKRVDWRLACVLPNYSELPNNLSEKSRCHQKSFAFYTRCTLLMTWCEHGVDISVAKIRKLSDSSKRSACFFSSARTGRHKYPLLGIALPGLYPYLCRHQQPSWHDKEKTTYQAAGSCQPMQGAPFRQWAVRFFFEQIGTLFIIAASPRPEYHIINHQSSK